MATGDSSGYLLAHNSIYMQICYEIWLIEAAKGAATTLDDIPLEWLCLFKKL